MPVIQQGWLRAVLFFAVYTGATIVAAMAFTSGLTVPAAADQHVPEKPALALMMVLAITITGIAITLAFRRFIDRQPLQSLGFATNHIGRELALGFLLSIVLIGGGVLILYANGNLRWTDGSFKGGDFFVLLVSMALLAISEEMVFRGYILNNLMESLNRRTALAASAALFTIAHLFNPGISAMAVVNLLLGGVLLGINFIYTRQLWFAIAFHTGWNFLQGPVFGFPVSGLADYSLLDQERKGNPLLTGSQFGFEGSIIATLLMLAAIIVLYFIYENNRPND